MYKSPVFNIISLVCLTLFMILPTIGTACTIFCGQDKNGHIWAANNEDGSYSFTNYINVFPKTEDTKYGYFTLSYESEKNGENGGIEGGMNEAGLFYDFNSIPTTLVKDLYKKKAFPEGDFKILSHILANFETVQEVIDFFNIYWFEVGFNSAQMHLADKYGNYGIIGPSGSRLLKNEPYQISTNFDICGNQDSSDRERYWRFPIVKENLEKQQVGLTSFTDICELTSIKGKGYYGGHTIYSNIQNLNTGDVWFYFTSDYKNPYKTSISELLSKGRKSYLIRDLFPMHPISVLYTNYQANGGKSAFYIYKVLDISKERKSEILSVFVSLFKENYDESLLPFLEEHLKSNPQGHWMRSARATIYFQNGDIEKAKAIVKTYKNEVPETSMEVDKILKLFDGKFEENTNVTIELEGYQDAKQVFVKGLPTSYDFLIKENGKWVGKYKIEPGCYNYLFMVDGKEVLDSKTPVKITASIYEDWYNSHQLCIGMSNDAYQVTIKVKVPNKDDIVYISGNQRNLTNWSPIFRLKKTSEYEREITTELHLPAKFKFSRGNLDTEAIMKGNKKDKDGEWLPMEYHLDSDTTIFEIKGWKS